MSQLSLILQEAVRRERAARTVLAVLREQMDDADGARGVVDRRSFKQRLRLSVFGCCGATWGFGRTSAIGAREGEEDQEPQNLPPQERVVITVGQAGPVNFWVPACVAPVSHGSGMNLAAALAAERQLRAQQDPEGEESVGPTGNAIAGTTAPGTPMRVSLMRLLEETEMDGCDAFGGGATALSEKTAEAGVGNDSVCCVCMGRKKGAAFIPCGHAFCRVCSREMWLNRGSCPLCNRSILGILDIF